MKFYKLALHKAYFDTGYSLLSYPKYVLILGGIGSVILTDGESTGLIMFLGVLVGIACYLIGRWCYKSGFIKATIEVSNQVNKFVQEMRKVYKP